jgi:hypothetical protein
MRVRFTVEGQTEDELILAAHRVLDGFSAGKRWNTTIEATPLDRLADGSIIAWTADVEANHEDIR